jgi:hypothetical protein
MEDCNMDKGQVLSPSDFTKEERDYLLDELSRLGMIYSFGAVAGAAFAAWMAEEEREDES